MIDTSGQNMRHTSLFATAILILAMLLLLPGCIIRAYDVDRLGTDYKSEGFLDDDHFQVVVSGSPDKDRKGLVQKRESALENAKNKLSRAAVDRLSAYFYETQLRRLGITSTKQIENFDDVNANLVQELAGYLKGGSIAFEYYHHDNTAVVVYRIIRRNLRNKIESITLPIAITVKQPGGKK